MDAAYKPFEIRINQLHILQILLQFYYVDN